MKALIVDGIVKQVVTNANKFPVKETKKLFWVTCPKGTKENSTYDGETFTPPVLEPDMSPLEKWEKDMKNLDRNEMPRWAEDIIENIQNGTPISAKTLARLAKKKKRRAERPA